jgi:hypothetical protein
MRVYLILLLAFFVVSCTANPSPTAANTIAPTNEPQPAPTQASGDVDYPAPGTQLEGYPAPDQTNANSGYPAPEGSGVVPSATLVMPTRDASLGSLKGRLLENGKPVEYADLYLANLLVNDEGKDVAFSFDRATSPRAMTNANGEFEFVNLPAGQYGLVYDIIVKSVLLLDPGTGEQMKVLIEDGKEVDAGALDYSELPQS